METLCRKDGLTVLLFTSDTDLARRADVVHYFFDTTSYIRSVKDTPERLLETYGCSSLDEVFASLCSSAAEEHANDGEEKETAPNERELDASTPDPGRKKKVSEPPSSATRHYDTRVPERPDVQQSSFSTSDGTEL